MAPASYTAPLAQPELYSSSPFYNTLQSYCFFGQGAKGQPRDSVRNCVGRGYLGRYGTCMGEFPKIITGGFPYSAAPDGTASGYTMRFTGGSKSISFAHSGYQTPSWHSTVGGVQGTVFCVFMIEEATGYLGALTILCQSTQSPYANQGGGVVTPYQQTAPGIGLCVVSDPVGSMYFGFSEDNSFGKSYYCTTVAPILKGVWYVGACGFYNGTDTFSTSIVNPRRLYLQRLDTNTLVCGGTGQTSQTFANPLGSAATPGVNKGYAGTQSNLPATGNFDFAVGCGADSTVSTSGHLIGQIHLAGLDQIFWDNTGQFAAPTSGTSSDPFAFFANDIYNPIRGTYATGSGGTTIINASAQNLSNGNSISPAGMGKVAGNYTTIANVIAGVPVDTGIVFIGDAAVTKVTNTQVEITVSRPQAAAAAITSYSLYSSLTAPFSPGGGNLVATQTVAGDPYTPHVFVVTPPTNAIYFYTVIATDASSNTYTYPQMISGLKAAPAIFLISAGNSFETATGGNPWIHMARMAQSFNVDMPFILTGFDGSVTTDWLSGTATKTTPFEASTYNPLSWLQAHLTREAAALGRPVDLVHIWLVENNSGDTSATYNGLMQTLATTLLNTGNVSRVSIAPWGNRILDGGNGLSNGTQSAVAITNGLPAIDNGTTIVLGSQWLPMTSSGLAFDFTAAHPGVYLAQIEGSMYIKDYMRRFVFPTYKVIGG